MGVKKIEIKTNQGPIEGVVVHLAREISKKVIYKFTNIPFAQITRFEKPKSFGKWSGTWNGRSRTTAPPQDSQMVDLFLQIKSFMPLLEKDVKLLKSKNPIIQG